MRFHATPHFARRTEDRLLSSDMVENTVKYGEKHLLRDGTHGGKVFRFVKTIDGKQFMVFAEIKKSECWLLTAYFNGS